MKRSEEMLEAVGLSGKSRHKIRTFSGGMKQRLGIAQAMLGDPRILILDEPTACETTAQPYLEDLYLSYFKGNMEK